MNEKVMFSSKTDQWSTPQAFFDKLNEEFHFTLDPCADESNHKCEQYFTKEQNGLSQDWQGNTVFCNPPYGRETGVWVKKCHDEAKKENTVCVMLIPARTDTRWFHEFIYGKAEIRFIKGRLKFGDGKNSAPFPSMVVIYGDVKNRRSGKDENRMMLPDYNDLFDRYDLEQEKKLTRLPKCCECDEHITEEYCFDFDGDLLCVDCLKKNHRKWVEDCVE